MMSVRSFLLAFTVAVSFPLLAQTTRTVSGKVTDASGAPIRKSTVYLENPAALGFRTCLTADDGTFKFIEVSAVDDFRIRARHGHAWSPTLEITHQATGEDIEIHLIISNTNPGGCTPTRPGC